jgi:hypothetical protein
MVEYAQTLPGEWVKARVAFVGQRLAELAVAGKPVRETLHKEIQLNLLSRACAGDNAKVTEIFSEAVRSGPAVVEAFRHCLVNWLADKVVDGWPPLPDELIPADSENRTQKLKECYPRWRFLERDLYFYRLKEEGLGPAAIRDRCHEEHPEWNLKKGHAGREAVEAAINRAKRKIEESGLSA